MKITKRQLRRITKEEKAKRLHERAGALLSLSTLEALNNALEVAYYEAIDGAMDDGLDEAAASDAAFAAIMEEVDGFADSMGHHNRGGRYEQRPIGEIENENYQAATQEIDSRNA